MSKFKVIEESRFLNNEEQNNIKGGWVEICSALYDVVYFCDSLRDFTAKSLPPYCREYACGPNAYGTCPNAPSMYRIDIGGVLGDAKL